MDFDALPESVQADVARQEFGISWIRLKGEGPNRAFLGCRNGDQTDIGADIEKRSSGGQQIGREKVEKLWCPGPLASIGAVDDLVPGRPDETPQSSFRADDFFLLDGGAGIHSSIQSAPAHGMPAVASAESFR